MSGKIINVPMDATMRDLFVTYVYRRWTEAVDQERKVKDTEFDRATYGDRVSYARSQDLAMKRTAAEIVKWRKLLDEVKIYSPLIRGE